MITYRLLRRLLRFALRIFFRRIIVVGDEHVPREGPVIFCGNHPNSLLDPILITALGGRVVHFAAKDVLFRSRFLRPFLRIAGAVPVRRRKDHPDGPLDNASAFAKLHELLGEGGAMGIFPEGISHTGSQLAQLKTGAARIAIGAESSYPGVRVRLVPCGLHYITRHRFRSSVLVSFGPPVEIDPERLATIAALGASGDDAAVEDARRDLAREVTDEIDQGLRALTVNAEDWDTLRVLDGVRRLYQPPRIRLVDRVELARRFNQHFPAVREQPEVAALYARVRDYLDRLDAVGLSDRDVRRELGFGERLLRLGHYAIWLFLWLPLGAVGALIHLPIGLLLGWTGERFAPRKDVIATTKFLAGFLTLLAIYVATPLVLWRVVGGLAGVIAAIALPLSGYATLRLLERLSALRRLFATSWRLATLQREVGALREERAQLVTAVIDAVNRFKPDDLELLFPRDAVAAPGQPAPATSGDRG